MCFFAACSIKTALLLCVLVTAPFVRAYNDIVYSTGFQYYYNSMEGYPVRYKEGVYYSGSIGDRWTFETMYGGKGSLQNSVIRMWLNFRDGSNWEPSVNLYRMVDTTDYTNVTVTFEWETNSEGRCLLFATYDDGAEWNNISGELQSYNSGSNVSTFADTQMDNNTGFGIKFSMDGSNVGDGPTCSIHYVRIEGKYIGGTPLTLPDTIKETVYSQNFTGDEEELEADGWTVHRDSGFYNPFYGGYVFLRVEWGISLSRLIDTTNYEFTSLEIQSKGICAVSVTYDGGVVWEEVNDSRFYYEGSEIQTVNLAYDRMNQNTNFGIKLGAKSYCYYYGLSITGYFISFYWTPFWVYNKTHLEDDGWVLSDQGVSDYYYDDNYVDWYYGRAVQTAVSGSLYRLFDTTNYTNVTVEVKWRASPNSEIRCRVWYKYVNLDNFIWLDLGGLDLVADSFADYGKYSQLVLTNCKMDHNPYLAVKIGATGDSIDGSDYCAFRDFHVKGSYDPDGTSCISGDKNRPTFFYIQDDNNWYAARDQESVDSNNGTLVCEQD